MAQSSALLAVLSVVVVATLCGLPGSAEAKTDLYDFCLKLELRLSSNKDASSDAEVAFREAQKHMRSFLNLGSAARLAKAWKTVMRDERCAKNSADIVNTIAECNPNYRGPMATLHHAVRRYSMKCLTPAFWDNQLDKTIGSIDKSGLTDFLSDQFLAQYRQENADEPELHFATVGGPNCCQPRRSQKALIQALAPIVGGPATAQRSIQLFIEEGNDSLEKTLDKHLFKPCERYIQNTDRMMLSASNAAGYYKPDEDAFVESLSEKFQAALFRYKYCSAFRYVRPISEKMRKFRLRESHGAGLMFNMKNNRPLPVPIWQAK